MIIIYIYNIIHYCPMMILLLSHDYPRIIAILLIPMIILILPIPIKPYKTVGNKGESIPMGTKNHWK